jgi:cell shape-determining protein MreC
MGLNLATHTRRSENLAVAVCAVLSIGLLALPSADRIRVAGVLGTVLTGPYDRFAAFVADVGRVRGENASLRAEVTALRIDREAAERLRRERDELRQALGLLDAAPSDLVPCEVQRRRVAASASLILVRSVEAVAWERYQPVITVDGLVGRVHTPAGPTAAWVELLNSSGVGVSCQLVRTGLPGILHPREGDEFDLALVGRDEDVEVGDRVVTSDIGLLQGEAAFPQDALPRGLPVGVVVGVESPPEQLFKEIRVKSLASFSRLDVVFAVVGRGDWLTSVGALPDAAAPDAAVPDSASTGTQP